MRRQVVTIMLLAVILVGALAGPARAQDSPPPPQISPSTTVQRGPLTKTGADVWPTVTASLVLLSVGTALVLVARRRRHTLAV